MLKSDFESTNLVIFEEVVNNFCRSDNDMIYNICICCLIPNLIKQILRRSLVPCQRCKKTFLESESKSPPVSKDLSSLTGLGQDLDSHWTGVDTTKSGQFGRFVMFGIEALLFDIIPS